MSERKIELIYFDGCPNADEARENLRTVLGAESWREWDLESDQTPELLRRHGSPTVLVDGRDVTSGEEATGAPACRADGAPSPEEIRKALAPRD